MKDRDLKSEYQVFIGTEGKGSLPRSLDQTVIQHIHQDMQPGARRVLSKFAVIHLFSSILTLSICPQFGLGPFFGQHGIMRYFMYFGDLVCIALCGAFYLSTTVAFAFLVMRPEEWRKLRELALPSFAGIAALSLLTFFILTQSGLVENLFWTISFVLSWFVAAVLAAKSTEKILGLVNSSVTRI
jgi:hypothetical protein